MATASESIAQWKAKVSLVGGTGVGKTSLIRRYVRDEFDDRYIITLGTKVSKRVVDLEFPPAGQLRVDLTLWDTMGEEFLRPTLYDTVLGGAKGVIVVCDVTDPKSIDPLMSWIDLGRRVRGDVPIQILLNKSDLIRSDEVVTRSLRIGRQQQAHCYLTSAKTGGNVVGAFEDLARRIAASTFAERNIEMDDVSHDILATTATEPRSVQDILAKTRVPLPALQSRLELLTCQGHLRVNSMEIGPDGRPFLKYVATGQGPAPAVASSGGGASRTP